MGMCIACFAREGDTQMYVRTTPECDLPMPPLHHAIPYGEYLHTSPIRT